VVVSSLIDIVRIDLVQDAGRMQLPVQKHVRRHTFLDPLHAQTSHCCLHKLDILVRATAHATPLFSLPRLRMVKDLVSSHVGYTAASDPGHHAGISSVNGGLAGSISLHTIC